MSDGYLNWKDRAHSCPDCGWTGKAKELTTDDWLRDLFGMNCPKCQEYVFDIEYPAFDGDPNAEIAVSSTTQAAPSIAEVINKAHSADPLIEEAWLPELEGDDLIFVLDLEKQETGEYHIIKYGDRVIWKEMAFDDQEIEYPHVLKFLGKKYGNRLQELVETRRRERHEDIRYLYSKQREYIRASEECESAEQRQATSESIFQSRLAHNPESSRQRSWLATEFEVAKLKLLQAFKSWMA